MAVLIIKTVVFLKKLNPFSCIHFKYVYHYNSFHRAYISIRFKLYVNMIKYAQKYKLIYF